MSVKTVILISVNSVVWVLNSVSFWQVGVKMPGYPSFANWIGILPYMIFIPFIYRDFSKPFIWKLHIWFGIYSLLSTLDSVLEILADSSTGGVVQAVCSAAIPIPFTAILSRIIFKRQFTLLEMLGSLIVIIASALLIFESRGVYISWWLIAYIAGLLLGCIYTIIWEYLFKMYDIEILSLMAWTTLYSLPLYFISIFIDGKNVWIKERDGFRCFFEIFPLPSGCLAGAWIPLTVYMFSSVISDAVQMYFVKNDSAYFLIIADTLTTPLTSIVVSFGFIFGRSAEPLTWYSIVACILVVIGILVYKIGDDVWICLKRTSRNNEYLLNESFE